MIRSEWIRVALNPLPGVLIRRGGFGHRRGEWYAETDTHAEAT